MVLRGTLIGCGFFAENHLHAWKELPGVELVAVCDIDADKAAGAAARFGIPRFYSDAEQMLSKERPDFVDIVTTVKSHRMLVELAARCAVPCICQKPFATSVSDGATMVEAARAAGVPLMVHENFRWQAPLVAVQRAIGTGAIGRPFFGRISFRHDFDVYKNQPYLAEASHFAILDVGIHLIDVARSYFGEVKRLACTTHRANPRVKGEDVATILMKHSSGASSIADCSFYTHLDPNPFPQTLVEIDGTAGSIRLGEGYQLAVTTGGRTTIEIVDVPVRPWMERPWHVVQDSVRNIQQHWIECLTERRQPATSGSDNLRTLALGLAAYEADETGRTIVFED